MTEKQYPAHLRQLADDMVAHFQEKWGDEFTDDDRAEIERYAFHEAKTTDVALECSWYEQKYAY